ncbi:MAG: Clp protease, partial [Desulfovibrionales bacterium]
ERQLTETLRMGGGEGPKYVSFFSLKDNLKLSDLFTYGMVPQFISRFSAIAVLADLGPSELKSILLSAPDSPLKHSQEYFKTLGMELVLTDEALDLIVSHSLENTRIGARALRDVFSRIITDLEFDPMGRKEMDSESTSGVLKIDRQAVSQSLGR